MRLTVQLRAMIFQLKKMLFSPVPASSVAVVGSLGTLLGVGATLVGVRVSNYQLETARQQLIITDRPWVKLNSIANIRLEFNSKFVFANIVLGSKNVGKSPAINIRYRARIFAIGFSDLEKQIEMSCREDYGLNPLVPGVLFPDEEYPAFVLGESNFGKIIDSDDNNIAGFLELGENGFKTSDGAPVNRYSPSVTIVVCASYDIFRDNIKHHTVSVFDVSLKNAKMNDLSKNRQDWRKDSFDISSKNIYTKDDLAISQPFGSSSQAD